MIPVTTAIQKKYILVKFLKLNDNKKKNQTVFSQCEKVAMLVTAGTPLLSVDR